ncbi:MAG: LysE family transporter [Pseudomonadota bacterium]
MTATSLLTFAIVLALGIALPGPTILALVTRVLTQGLHGCLQLCLGLLASDMVWLACAIFGFAALGELPPVLFELLKWAGCGYLLYLARGMWLSAAHGAAPATPRNATVALPGAGSSHAADLLAGLGLGLGNPKTALFYLALLPTLLQLRSIDLPGGLLLAGVVLLVYGTILAAYVALASQVRRFFDSPGAMQRLQRLGSVMMLVVAAVFALR